jgi:hypothetical protein
MSNHSKNPRRKRATDNPDHARRNHVAAPADAELEARLTDLVQPAVFAELAYYRQLGLRHRLLTLPVMVALVLTLLWRRVPGVTELTRLLARERLLWTAPLRVSQPALSERLLTLPAVLFERIFNRVISELPARAAQRTRPVPPLFRRLGERFGGCYALDGTTLEALFRKLKALQERPDAPLAGRLVAAVDLLSHLPAQVWWAEDPASNDKALLPQVKGWLKTGSLVVFDLGYFAFTLFDELSERQVSFVTRLRSKTSYRVEQTLLAHPQVRDQLVHLGAYRANPSRHPVRLIEVYVEREWRQYLTNVLDPNLLSVVDVVELYSYRWRIEGAFLLVKRLLDLAYLWVGSQNGVQLQVWATWLFDAVLIDLCDDVAEALGQPLERISVEMVYRGLYHYVTAHAHGFAGDVPTYYAQHGHDLGLVKRVRPRAGPSPLAQLRLALDLPALADPHLTVCLHA